MPIDLVFLRGLAKIDGMDRAVLPLALLALTAVATADVTFGGTRASGMGGAGLALPVDVFQNSRLNPALHGYGTRSFRFQFPQFGYRTDGISVSDVTDLGRRLSSGSGNEALAIRLARQYGERRRDFGVAANAAVFGGGFTAFGEGEASVASRPNAVLRQFIASGANPDNTPLDAQLDAYGFGYYSFGVGYANAVNLPRARFSTGIRVKQVRGYYAHKIANGPSIANNTTGGVGNGTDIPGNENTVDARGVGVDLGGIYSDQRLKGFTFGAVIENAVQPNIRFASQAPADEGGAIRRGFVNPFRTAFNTGVGYMYRENILGALDLVDLGNRAGRSELRAGIEVGLSRAFAARAGYNSRTGFTYGIAAGGFNLQLGGTSPVTIGTTVRF